MKKKKIKTRLFKYSSKYKSLTFIKSCQLSITSTILSICKLIPSNFVHEYSLNNIRNNRYHQQTGEFAQIVKTGSLCFFKHKYDFTPNPPTTIFKALADGIKRTVDWKKNTLQVNIKGAKHVPWHTPLRSVSTLTRLL